MHPLRGTRLGAASVIAAGIVLSSPSTQAQEEISGTPYIRFIERNATLEPISGGGTLIMNEIRYFNGTRFVDETLPFPFKFYDQESTDITVGQGIVWFEDANRPSFVYFPSSSYIGSREPNQFLAPLWTPLQFPNAGSGVFVGVEGRAPSRQYVIDWRNAAAGTSFPSGAGSYTFQVRLYEGLSGRIDITYGSMTNPIPYTFAGVMGMEDETGGRFVPLSAGTACDGTPASGSGTCPFSDQSSRANQRVTFVQDPGVELVGLGLEVPQFATLGAPIQIPVSVANAHRNPLGPFDVNITASRTRDGANKVVIGTANIALQPFQTSTPVIDVTPPVTLGENSYFLFLEVDAGNTVDEVDEVNNVFRGLTQVRFLPSRPDLQIDRVDLGGRTVNAGDSVDVTVSLTNVGSEPVTAGEIAIMLSSNPVISANDGQLGSQSVTVNAGESTQITVPVTIPAGTNSGAYYIGALADPSGMITEINESNNGLAALNTIDVLGGTVAILTTALPQALLQESYVALMAGTGGSGQYNWEITAGMLPPGLGIVAATGEFFGRPTAEGCEMFTMQLTDVQNTAATATQDLQLCVTTLTEPLTVVTRSVPPAVAGQEYSFNLVATGGAMGAAPEWSATGLPSGFAVTTAGVLAGTGDSESSTTFTVSVTNGTETATRELTLDVQTNNNLQIEAEPLPVARVGEAYSYQFSSNGGIEPITWILALGSLDDLGLDLSPSGELSGIPTRAGRFRFTAEARDAGPPGRAARDENSFELIVQDDGDLQITTDDLPPANVNAGYDRAIAAIGGLPPYTWTLQKGRLPEGLTGTTNPVTNEYRIAGTPTEEVRANILIAATDSEGRVTTRAFVVDVGPEILVVVEEDSGCAATRGQADFGLLLLAALGLIAARRRRE